MTDDHIILLYLAREVRNSPYQRHPQ